MNVQAICEQFLNDIGNTTWYEYVAVIAGVISVWYSRKENILVYPIGLINTIIYIYISFKGHLLGEATVNFYYTIMSLIGWYMWQKKETITATPALKITLATQKEWLQHLLFFTVFYVAFFLVLTQLKQYFYDGVIPWADALASATAFTGMWLMTKKKVENWYWWIATNITSIPLYFVKHYVFTSVYYVILLVLAVFGLITWLQKIKASPTNFSNADK